MQRLLTSLLGAAGIAIIFAVLVAVSVGTVWLISQAPWWLLCSTPALAAWAFAWVTYEEWGA